MDLEIHVFWLFIHKLFSCSGDPLAMTKQTANLTQYWYKRLATECPELSEVARESIVIWLLGLNLERFKHLNPRELEITQQSMEYRWRILHRRYLGLSREHAYRYLINRLGSVVILRNKIQTWITLSRDRQRSVIDVLQEVLQELLQSDSYMQQQMAGIAKITKDGKLRDALLFASLEEYCLRPVRNQPLLVYRFVNYIRRAQRGGLTQVPASDLIRLVSEESLTEDSENRTNLIDSQAIVQYQEAQYLEDQQFLRQAVKQEFEQYLLQKLGQEALDWLRFYLQGKSQEEIAQKLHKPIHEIYRLREKISYHAVRVFAIKGKRELVDNWLSNSLREHNFGLTQRKWQLLNEQLTPLAGEILNMQKAGHSIETIAKKLNLKTHQVMGEWTKIYLAAQNLRTQD